MCDCYFGLLIFVVILFGMQQWTEATMIATGARSSGWCFFFYHGLKLNQGWSILIVIVMDGIYIGCILKVEGLNLQF